MTVPVLETERLILRGPAAHDWDGFRDFYASERSRYVSGPLDTPRTWILFAAEIQHWVLRGFGMWAVTAKGDDTCLGLIGCWYPEGWPEKEIGWLLWPQAEGHGFGFEAATAARSHAYAEFRWTTAVSYIDHENARSIALARRLAATRDHDAATPRDADCGVYRHPAPESLG